MIIVVYILFRMRLKDFNTGMISLVHTKVTQSDHGYVIYRILLFVETQLYKGI